MPSPETCQHLSVLSTSKRWPLARSSDWTFVFCMHRNDSNKTNPNQKIRTKTWKCFTLLISPFFFFCISNIALYLQDQTSAAIKVLFSLSSHTHPHTTRRATPNYSSHSICCQNNSAVFQNKLFFSF